MNCHKKLIRYFIYIIFSWASTHGHSQLEQGGR